ncbi:MAG TPA: cupin domain-containing protein [Pirellulales bacterium]|jgi:quercetin dioxygenase-like cupin family protein|nr:cupin domain-containing protein [Pirellulales bacterium]
MLTKREFVFIVAVALVTFAAVTWAQSPAKPLLKSAAYDWSKTQAQANKTGFKRQFFDGPTATLEQLECHATTVNPGQATHAPVPQPADELIIVKEGTLEAQIDGQPQRVGPGSVLFTAANDLHGVQNVGDTPATYYVIKCVAAGTKSP